MIWDFLLTLGISEYATAGMLGNLYAESHNNPTLAERSRHNRIRSTLDRLFEENDVEPTPPGTTVESRNAATDRDYIIAINHGWYTVRDFQDGVGFGISQWTWFSRKRDLHNYISNNVCSLSLAYCITDWHCYPDGETLGFNIACLDRQLRFLAYEMQNYVGGTFWRNLQNVQSVREASDLVLSGFMKPSNQHVHSPRRAGYSEGFHAWFAND